MPTYYLKEHDILLRDSKGKPDEAKFPPDQVLWPEGWTHYPLFDDVDIWDKIDLIDEDQAKHVAQLEGLPIEGWDVKQPKKTEEKTDGEKETDAEPGKEEE